MAAFLALLATDCTNFVDMSIRLKAKIGIFCAFLEFFAGIFLGICISLYAANINFDYKNRHKDQRFMYEFGPCIYLGWAVIATELPNGSHFPSSF